MAVESLVTTTPSTAVEPSAGLGAGLAGVWAKPRLGDRTAVAASSRTFKRKTSPGTNTVAARQSLPTT